MGNVTQTVNILNKEQRLYFCNYEQTPARPFKISKEQEKRVKLKKRLEDIKLAKKLEKELNWLDIGEE